MAICRGKRLHHGQPFVVFALDLRDPLGSCLATILHALGDSRRAEDVRRHAERRERAPTVVAPASLRHARELLHRLEATPDLDARLGCTPGDLRAVRAFVEGLRWPGDGVAVFLAADDERSVFLYPHRLRGRSVEIAVHLRHNTTPANNNHLPPDPLAPLDSPAPPASPDPPA